MRTWALAVTLAVAIGCSKRLPDIAEAREIRDGELVARVAGPVKVAGDAEGLLTVTNTGKKPFDTRVGECSFTAVSPGERRACAYRFGDSSTIQLAESVGSTTKLRLKETSIRSTGHGSYAFHGVVVNDSWKPRRVAVSFLAATKTGHIAGGHTNVEPAKPILAVGEESVVDATFFVTIETPADAALTVSEEIAKGGEAFFSPSDAKQATLTNFHAQRSNGATQWVGTLTNVARTPLYSSAFLYFQDKRGRTIGGGTCRDVPRLDANVALAPQESLVCLLLPGHSIPASWDHIEVDTGRFTFDSATLRAMSVEGAHVEKGVVRAAVRNTTTNRAEKTIVYTRLQPEWFKAELIEKPIAPGESLSFETPAEESASAEVTAFAVVGKLR